ncbi:MAG: molybdopterin molybdotransferase MoeA [bacterium]|nr:molybdopterin molybdotransferase MoeA [bacterium]
MTRMSEVAFNITVDKAREIILAHTRPPHPIVVSLADALGRTLAKDVTCDLDYPPFDRAMMDGYAVRSADVSGTPVTLQVIGQGAAGAPAASKVEAGQAVQINTGAPMPPGADAVVPVEHTEPSADGAAVSILKSEPPGRHRALRASSVSAGDVVLRSGSRVGPGQIGVAASAGACRLWVFPPPVVAVLATGDEIVDVARVPQGAQIRNSNSYVLEALIAQAGGDPRNLGNAVDDPAELEAKIRAGLAADVLCITGGISMGEFDYVPQVLRKCGVRFLVHKMRIKPGRPTIFGVSDGGTLVFGLPGNPVSAFVAFVLTTAPALAALQGRVDDGLRPVEATLKGTLKPAGDRQAYAPARVSADDDARLIAEALIWKGSSDPFGLASANGMTVQSSGEPGANNGDTVRVLLTDRL